MRILYISSLFPRTTLPQYGGFVEEQILAVSDLGINITVLVPLNSEDYLKQTDKVINKKAVVIKYFQFDSFFPGSFNLWLASKQMARIVLKLFHNDIEECDLVHAHETLCAGYVAKRIFEKYAKPYIVTVHGLDVGFHFNSPNILAHLNKKYCTEVYNNSHTSIGVSKKTSKEILQIAPSAHTEVVYNGFNPQIFNIVNREYGKRFHILCAGNLIELKRFCDVIEACAELERQGKKFSMELYGKGPLKEEIEQRIEELGLKERICLGGYVLPQKLAAAMKKADVFVMPSEYESFGCVYVEAMACGIPIIACRGQGIEEIIQDGVHGRLVSPRNPMEIAEVLIEMIDNREKYQQMAHSAFELSHQFTWKASAKKLVNIYQEVIS